MKQRWEGALNTQGPALGQVSVERAGTGRQASILQGPWILLRTVSELQCDPSLFPLVYNTGMEVKESPKDPPCPSGEWPCLCGSGRLKVLPRVTRPGQGCVGSNFFPVCPRCSLPVPITPCQAMTSDLMFAGSMLAVEV